LLIVALVRLIPITRVVPPVDALVLRLAGIAAHAGLAAFRDRDALANVREVDPRL
jgi:hypothetical protein